MTKNCNQCGATNHVNNGSCLNCGANLGQHLTPAPQQAHIEAHGAVESTAAVAVEEPAAAPDPVDHQSIESLRTHSYLFQEPSGPHVGRYFFLILLCAGIAVAGWRWHDVRSFAERFAQNAHPIAATNPAPPPAGASPAPQPPMSSPEAPAPQTPQPVAAPVAHDTTPEPQPAPPSKPQIRRTASRGASTDAPELEGEKYLYGDSVPQNCDIARKDLLKAAKHSAKAQTDLAAMYATGHCALRDLPLAYRWFSRAQHHGDPKIAEDMRVLWNQMTPEERRLATR